MSRKVLATISLVIEAGSAKPSPPVGPALGAHGLNILSFCKEFNARTAEIKQNVPVPVKITAFTDRTFEWNFSSPPTSFLLLKAAGVKSGSAKPGHMRSGTVSVKHIYEIAKVKKSKEGNKFVPIQSICSSIIGSSKSMGLDSTSHTAHTA
jgi:large subunit ribosomal protein L11